MIHITRGGPTPNFIQEIKHIREYCEQRYGATSGLREAKELIESVMARYPKTYAIDSVLLNRLSDIANSLDYGDRIELLSVLDAIKEGEVKA